MKVVVLDSPRLHGKIVCSIIREMDSDVEIELIGVTDRGGHANNEDLCRGLVRCLFSDVGIINISLGLPCMSEEVSDIIDKLVDKGVIVVASSGNGYSTYPGLHDKVISVGALDADGNIASYSAEADVYEYGEYEYQGRKYNGTSFSCARHTGKLCGGGD